MSPHIVAIDAGGTAIKVALYDLAGQEKAAVGEVIKPLVPAAGHAERDPQSMWAIVCRCLRQALHDAKVTPDEVAVVGLTGYGNGLLLLDEAGWPVRPAILAPDQRAASLVQRWRDDGLEGDHLALTHQRLWPGKPLPLLAWIERHEPATLGQATHALTCKDYLRFRLTNVLGMEISDASTSSLIDHAGRVFTPAVFDLFGLGRHAGLIPPLLEPLTIAGSVTAQAAVDTGLRPGTPVSAGYADGPAMLLALGITDDTLLNVVAGTWGLNQLLTRQPKADGSILACSLGARRGDYVLIDGGPTSASAFEWFVDAMHPDEGDHTALYDRYNRAVAALGPEEAPVYFLPYLNGRLDLADARGTFLGLTSAQGLPHMARAIFEGVAMEHRTHVDALLAGRPRPRAVRFAGGAARSKPWLDIFAATLQLPIEVGAANELGCLGAAIIAAVGAGLYPDLETAVASMTSVRARIEPRPDLVTIADKRFARFLLLCDTLAPVWTSV